MTTTASRFIWYELSTNNKEAAAAFYSEVVGWTVQHSDQPGMDYSMWQAAGSTIGGMMPIMPQAAEMGMRPTWLAYISVADVDQSIASITGKGGRLLFGPIDMPGVGRFATVTDPQGAAFYVMTPAMPGESTCFAHGTPGHIGWNELYARDRETAFAFYAQECGWEKSDAIDMGAMGIYQLFKTGDVVLGGMMTNTNPPQPMWCFYFNVPDINAAKARVEAGGGTVLNGPMQVPGGQFVLQALDPEGAAFGLVAPAPV
jgi:uncharacterized protein